MTYSHSHRVHSSARLSGRERYADNICSRQISNQACNITRKNRKEKIELKLEKLKIEFEKENRPHKINAKNSIKANNINQAVSTPFLKQTDISKKRK